MKEWSLISVSSLIGMAILCFTVVKCSEQSRNALNLCIEKTGKPLECQATFRNQP
jgi:hypothetical protein